MGKIGFISLDDGNYMICLLLSSLSYLQTGIGFTWIKISLDLYSLIMN